MSRESQSNLKSPEYTLEGSSELVENQEDKNNPDEVAITKLETSARQETGEMKSALAEDKESLKDIRKFLGSNETSSDAIDASENRIANIEKENVAKVLKLFNENKLLARAMEPIRLRADGKFDFSVWNDEVDLLKQDELKYASSTLLVEGQPEHTYKPYGFLFNADKSKIAHISEQDSNSSGGTEQEFNAAEQKIQSIDELASIINKRNMAGMNEVNAHFNIDGLEGIFVREESPSSKLEAIGTHLYLKSQGLDYPLFQYSQKRGEIIPFDYKEANVSELLNEVKVGVAYKDRLKHLFESFGMKV